MISVGLSDTDRKKFEDALRSTHMMRLNVTLLDRDEKPIGSLTAPSGSVLDGDVQIDNTGETKRSLRLTILDPDAKLQIAPDSPADQAVFADNFVAVEYGVWVGELDSWVDTPVFWGPVTILQRQEEKGTVHIEAIGKEYLLKKPHLMWKTKKFRKHASTVDVIHDIVAAKGESRFDLPSDIKRKLPKPLIITRDQEPWKVIKKLAQSTHRQLFYDGRGMLRLRSIPENPVYVFETTDNGGEVLTSPSVNYDISKVRNTVEVLGHKNDQKRQVRAVAYAGKNHPLSPYSLRRNGEPRYIVEQIKNEHVDRVAKAKEIAIQHLRKLLRANVEVQFTCLPVPHLEEQDIVVLMFNDWRVDFPVTQMTIPLTEDGTMSINFNKVSKKILKKDIIVKPKHMKHHGGGH